MRVKELIAEEQVMLCALVQEIVAADGKLTEEETDALEFLSFEMGEEAWQLAFDRASGRFRGLQGLLELARSVRRHDARMLIHQMAELVADSDGMAPEEQAVLDAVAQQWGLV